MKVDRLALTVRDIDVTCGFHCEVLGMEVVTFGGGRKALSFGSQKITLHQGGHVSQLIFIGVLTRSTKRST